MSLEHAPSRSADKMLRALEVMAQTGHSRTTIWRKVRAGTFPAPIELGPNAVGWPQSWITKYLAELRRRTYGAETPYREAEQQAREEQINQALTEAVQILLRLTREDLGRLVEIVREDAVGRRFQEALKNTLEDGHQ